jgi:beta-glucanase (GH16 family)
MAQLRYAAALCLTLAACQVASAENKPKTESVELRLPERSKGAPPPIVAPPSYAVDTRELMPTEKLPQHWSAPSKLALSPSTFIPGRSYRLTFTAGVTGGEAKVGITFKNAKKEPFRAFQQSVGPGAPRTYQLEFTAPAYTEAAELVIDVQAPELSLDNVSLRMRAALLRTAPVASWAGSFVPRGYGLVFNDEFDGTELDRKKWFTRYIYSGGTLDRLNQENEHYTDNGNHRVAGGVLYLTANKLKLGQPSGVNYESGMIRSDFTVRYGFFEARVKMPAGLGVWPAFWLNSDVSDKGALGWPPEIDIFEFVNNGKDDKLNMLHSSTTDTPGAPTQYRYASPDFNVKLRDYIAPFQFSDAFHTIGAEWTPTEVSVYIDGLKVATSTFQWKYADGSLAAPAHVLLNLAIGDGWAGRYGIDDSAFPQALAVDWVRVYQKP